MAADSDLPNKEDPNSLKIVKRTKTRLTATYRPFHPVYPRTLRLISKTPRPQTWAMIDDVLAWIGIPDSDIDEAREKYHSYDSEFIIERPGDPTGNVDMLSSRNEGDAPLIHDPEGGSGSDTDRANDAKWQPLRSDGNGFSWGNEGFWMEISPALMPQRVETLWDPALAILRERAERARDRE